jgi:hypothetical protein
MNKYLDKLSHRPTLPRETLLDLDRNKYYSALRADNKYFSALSTDGMELLATTLNTPGIEATVSRDLASQFNLNTSIYDKAIDHSYVATHIGGSGLHHNLDGSHTFWGAMESLRGDFPGESDFQLRLHALEHLARDFTTPSGINPLLSPPDFLEVKGLLEEFGVSPSLANDLLNFNAAELAGSLVGAGALLFQLRSRDQSIVSAQATRLATTQFFAGNVLGLIVATAILLRLALEEDSNKTDVTIGAFTGAGQILLAAALLPNIPLSVSLIIGTTACMTGRMLLGGSYDIAGEMEKVLTAQFPRYKSYFACL